LHVQPSQPDARHGSGFAVRWNVVFEVVRERQHGRNIVPEQLDLPGDLPDDLPGDLLGRLAEFDGSG
jgi:hypothetical protein